MSQQRNLIKFAVGRHVPEKRWSRVALLQQFPDFAERPETNSLSFPCSRQARCPSPDFVATRGPVDWLPA